MGVYKFLGQFSFLMIALECFTTADNQSSFQVQCDFGDSYYSTETTVKVNGSLTSQFSNARNCHVKHRSDSAIIRVSVGGFNASSNLSTLYSMVLEHLRIQFVGVAQSHDLQNMQMYTFHACPSRNKGLAPGKTTDHDAEFLFFGAPANSSFAVEVELDNSVLPSGEMAEFSVRSDGLARVSAFDIHEEQLFRLFQITVASEESEMECLLVVSQSCSAAQSQGLSENNAGAENQTIQLTFTKSGRITLSQYSRPKITTGRWYIGLHSKNVDKESAFEKTVKVTVTQGYKYDTIGKALPAGYMCLTAIFGGIAISLFAHFFLNSDFDECSVPFHMENSDEMRTRAPSRGIVDFVPKPIPRKTFPIKKWLEVIFISWFCKGIKTYPYLTGVLAISFMVGSAQFVIARWSSMIKGGNRDLCYYNELCYRPISVADMPSNFMLSNVPYVIHGIFLALSFSFREAITLQVNGSRRKYVLSSDHKQFRPYDYSVAYALSWALVFEGLFSAMYHLCPSRLTFQFDSAFMFIISGLVVVALFNCRVNSEALMDPEEKEEKAPHETSVQAPKYFLFFVAPLLVFNYVGSVRDTDGLTSFFEVSYWIALVIWLIVLYVWTFQKIGVPCRWNNYCGANGDCWSLEAVVKWTWIIIFPLCLLIIGFKQKNDFSQFFLFSCVAAVALTILGLMSFDIALSFKRHRSENGDCCGGVKQLCNPSLIWKTFWSNWHRVLFMVATFIFWVFAMYFFKLKSTTRKVAAPSFSRTLNAECVLWDFFDYHDIWHMLSSFALLMSAYLLIYVTRKVEIYYWAERMYWKSRAAANGTSGESTEKMVLQIDDAGKEDNYEIVEDWTLDKTKLRDKYDIEYGSVSYV